MSVHERLFLRTGLSAFGLSSEAAGLVGGLAEDRGDHAYLLVDTALLVPGTAGEYGGPVLRHESELPFRPAGEFEAVDCYNREIRLWRALGPAGMVEAAAAEVIFAALVGALDAPIIHVRDEDKLVAAALPGKGVHRPPAGTTTYDWDEGLWGGFVLTPRAPR